MEEHFAIRKDARDFPVHPHIGDVKDGWMAAALERVEIVYRRAQLAEARRKPHLIHFVQILIAKQRNAVFFPSALDAGERFVIHFAQIDIAHVHANGG
jgi:hypothetical protein